MKPRLLLATILVAACSRPPVNPESDYSRIWQKFRSGNLVAARTDIEQHRERRPPEGLWAWRFRLLEAEVLLGQAETQKAHKLLTEQTPAPTPGLEARRLTDLADALLKLDRVREAADALAAARAQNGVERDWPDAGLHMSAVESAVLIRSQKYERATAVTDGLLEHASAARNGYYTSAALINLSMIALRQRRFDQTVTFARQAQDEAKKSGALRMAALASVNLAVACSQLGDFDCAKDAQRRAADTLQMTGDQRASQGVLGELGNIHIREGNPSAALPLYEQAYAVARKTGQLSAAELWAGNLAVSLQQQNRWPEARKWNDIALELAEQVQPSALPFLNLNSGIITAGLGDSRQAKQQLLQVRQEAGDNASVGWETEAALARVERRLGNPAGSNAHFEAALDIIDKASEKVQQAQFRVTLHARLIGMYRDYVESLLDQKRVERALEVAESSRAQLLAEHLGRDVTHRTHGSAQELIRKARASGTVFLSYWLNPKRPVVWVASPRGITLVELPQAGDLRASAERYQRNLLEGTIEPLEDPAAAELSRALVEPVRPHVPPGSSVVIVPDGPMHALNLEVLPAGKRYWIEEATIALAPSLLLIDVARSEGLKSALLIGAPTFASAEFPVLRFAPQELRVVQRQLGRISVALYEGQSATAEAYVREADKRPSIVHFAAHGDVRYENPFDSAIILSGANGSERLRARDISAKPLDAELVTVSACKSAGARAFSGEGLTGLAWAFLQSGARNVVAGSWDVSDQSSTALMEQFYGGVARGQTPVESLREAKLRLLRSNSGMRHPFYWAPLQIFVRTVPVRNSSRT